MLIFKQKMLAKNLLSRLTNYDNEQTSGQMISAPTRTEQKNFLHNITYSVYNLHTERCVVRCLRSYFKVAINY